MSDDPKSRASDPDPETKTAVGRSNPPIDESVIIGNYRLIRRLGEGGMGAVWEAEQQHPRRLVALKQIRGTFITSQQIKLFEREVQALARLRHPGIAAIFDAGHTPQGEPFFTMELVRGESLSAYATSLPASSDTRTLVRIFLQVCEAVSYAHQRGVIHRDLKPGNILVTKDRPASARSGNLTASVKVLDFGLARVADPDMAGRTIHTEAGHVQGTLAYMSPEQVRGNPDEIDVRTDVYSLGVILFELITGQLPYNVDHLPLVDAARVICEQDPPRSRALAARVSRDLDAIARKALDKDPRRRYQSVAALAEDLDRFLHDEPVSARPPSAGYQIRKLVVRHKWPVALAGSIVVLLATLAVVMSVQSARLARERDRAHLEAETSRRVTDFLIGLFTTSDPSESRGNTVTAREVLDRGVAHLDTELKDEPAIRARLQNAVGRVYTNLGLYREARPLLTAALDTSRARFGPDSLETAAALYAIAALAGPERGNLDTAVPLSRQAMEIRRKLLGLDDLEYTASLEQLATLTAESHAGAADADADRYAKESLDIRKRRLGGDHALVAESMFTLGLVSEAAGDFDRALPYVRDSLAMQRRLLGNDHPSTIRSLEFLENLVGNKGMHLEATELARELASTSRKTLGPTNPFVWFCQNELAGDLSSLGQFDEAATVTEAALRDVQDRSPEMTRLLMHNLALVRASMNDMPSAIALLLKAKAIVVPPNNPDALSTPPSMGGLVSLALAEMYNATQQPKLALAAADEAAILCRATDDWSCSLQAKVERADALRQFRPADAPAAFRDVLARQMAAQIPKPKTPELWYSTFQMRLARTLAAVQRYEEADAIVREQLPYQLTMRTEQHFYIRVMQTWIARMHAEWKK